MFTGIFVSILLLYSVRLFVSGISPNTTEESLQAHLGVDSITFEEENEKKFVLTISPE